MRILLALIFSFFTFFYLGDIINRIFKKFTFSWVGLAMIIAGIVVSFPRNNFVDSPPLEALLAYALIGGGFGLITYHLLAKHFVFNVVKEHAFVKEHIQAIDSFLEKVPGILTWLALTSPVWMSFILPFAVAYLVIIASFYWLFNSIKIAACIYIGYRKIEWVKKINWLNKLKGDFKDEWQDYYHLVLLPTYNEDAFIIKPAIEALITSNYPQSKIFLCIGLEERNKIKAPEQFKGKEDLVKEYRGNLGGMFTPIHPMDLPGEIPGPGTNRNWMLKISLEELKKRKIDPEKVIVTTLDADFVVHKDFLAGLLHKYLSTPALERNKRTYTGSFLYYNNYWQTPTPMRLMAIGTSFWQLAEMVASDKYQNFSSMSINMSSLLDIGGWFPDKVNDDSGFYWKAYFHFKGDYKVISHFLPIYADAVLDTTLAKTFVNQYQQLKRWAYGVEHFPYIVHQYFKRTDINFWNKTDKLQFLLWANLKWTALALFINFAGILIGVVNPSYNQSVLSINLPIVSSWILTAAFLGLSATVYVHEKTVPPRPKNWSIVNRIWSYMQWLLVPITLITIATIPAIHAQTILMFGRHIEYRTTNKARATT